MPNQEENASPSVREVHHFDILVCCSGQHQVPRQTHLEEPFTHFTGTARNSASLAHLGWYY